MYKYESNTTGTSYYIICLLTYCTVHNAHNICDIICNSTLVIGFEISTLANETYFLINNNTQLYNFL